MSEKIEIENNNNNVNNNEFNINGNNKMEFDKLCDFKLDFYFDILNEPLTDFIINKNKNENFFLNSKNFAYKRSYNQIKVDLYSYLGGASLKLK